MTMVTGQGWGTPGLGVGTLLPLEAGRGKPPPRRAHCLHLQSSQDL